MHFDLKEIVGSVAGDNTIFILVRNIENVPMSWKGLKN